MPRPVAFLPYVAKLPHRERQADRERTSVAAVADSLLAAERHDAASKPQRAWVVPLDRELFEMVSAEAARRDTTPGAGDRRVLAYVCSDRLSMP
jgi:hypothetical protein